MRDYRTDEGVALLIEHTTVIGARHRYHFNVELSILFLNAAYQYAGVERNKR